MDMSAGQFLLFGVATYGLTLMAVNARIFDRIRPNLHFFHCAMCMGFWVGMLVAWWGCAAGFWGQVRWFGLPIFGLAGSGTSYLLMMLVDDEGLR